MSTGTKKGSTYAKYEDFNFDALAAKVAKAHPLAGYPELYEHMQDAANRDRKATAVAVLYTCVNAMNNYLKNHEPDAIRARGPRTPPEPPTAPYSPPPNRAAESYAAPEDRAAAPPARAPRVYTPKEEIEAAAESIRVQISILKMQTPDGRTYAEQTKAEMIRFGVWGYKVAAGMRDGQTVGECYTDEQLLALLGKGKK